MESEQRKTVFRKQVVRFRRTTRRSYRMIVGEGPGRQVAWMELVQTVDRYGRPCRDIFKKNVKLINNAMYQNILKGILHLW